MTRILRAFALVLLAANSALSAKEALRDGDIVFSSSKVGQGEAIIAATASPYTHCGIVFTRGGKLMVLEAVEPVGVIPLEQFAARSMPGTFLAKRLKTPVTPEKFRTARTWGEAQIGKNYDVRFQWGDDKLYCSELVWKVYKHAGVELCKPRTFKDYDLNKPSVKKIVDERFGGIANLPMNEKVVAPSDIAASGLLEDIAD